MCIVLMVCRLSSIFWTRFFGLLNSFFLSVTCLFQMFQNNYSSALSCACKLESQLANSKLKFLFYFDCDWDKFILFRKNGNLYNIKMFFQKNDMVSSFIQKCLCSLLSFNCRFWIPFIRLKKPIFY